MRNLALGGFAVQPPVCFMRRILCGILSVTILTSALSSCATAPVRPAAIGPDVYGYTLNQQLSYEQIQRLAKSDKKYFNSVSLYQQTSPDGGELGLYTDSKLFLNTLTSTSRAFLSESDCQAAQKSELLQLDAHINDFNNQHLHATGPLRQPGDVYARRAVDECHSIEEKDQEVDTFNYTLWVTLQTASLKPERAFPRQFEQTHSPAWDVALVIVLMPILVVAWAISGDPCNSDSPPAQRRGYCNK